MLASLIERLREHTLSNQAAQQEWEQLCHSMVEDSLLDLLTKDTYRRATHARTHCQEPSAQSCRQAWAETSAPQIRPPITSRCVIILDERFVQRDKNIVSIAIRSRWLDSFIADGIFVSSHLCTLCPTSRPFWLALSFLNHCLKGSKHGSNNNLTSFMSLQAVETRCRNASRQRQPSRRWRSSRHGRVETARS